MIVKVKSREMTALSKSNREKIRAVKDQRETVSEPTWGQLPAEERETHPLWALLLCISFTVFSAGEQDSSCSGLDLVFEYTLEGGEREGQKKKPSLKKSRVAYD